MYPLFEGRMGCFSPSVSKAILCAWVQHGGTLTHSVEDFHRADSFFCNGMEDPWLEKLLARSFIVMHPNWILKSISENFPMPISKYVLDDFFDSRKVTFEDRHNGPQTPVVSTRTRVESWRANLTKRPHEDIEDSFRSIDLRPPKKPRLEPISKQVPDTRILDSLPLLKTQKQQLSPPQSPPRRINLARHRPHPTCTVNAFKKHCKMPSSHETFWTAFHDEHIKTGSMRLPIATLLKAPPVKVTQFVPHKFYRQKEFTAAKRRF